MNITRFSLVGSGQSGTYSGGSIFTGGLMGMRMNPLKSTQEKTDRMQKSMSELNYWEQKKESLKGMECETLEKIGRKLDMLHSYEDEMSAVKMAYNYEQMWHTMDEYKEIGEKIAEEAEKNKPKTEEERKEELIEEAVENITGEEKSEGMLSEAMDELEEIQEEFTDQVEGDILEKTQNTLENMDIKEEEQILENTEELTGSQEENQLKTDMSRQKFEEVQKIYQALTVQEQVAVYKRYEGYI